MNLCWQYLLPFSWAICIAVLGLLPQHEIPHPHWFSFQNADKAIHAFLFFVLFALVYRSILKSTAPNFKHSMWVVTYCVIYGLLIEIAQYIFTVDRAFEWLDICFNSIGSITSAMVCYYLLPPKIFFTSFKI
jgi:VanZ family protein